MQIFFQELLKMYFTPNLSDINKLSSAFILFHKLCSKTSLQQLKLGLQFHISVQQVKLHFLQSQPPKIN